MQLQIKMRVTKHLDWLSVTIPQGENWRKVISPCVFVANSKGGKHGYRSMYRCSETGAILETDSDNEAQGSHFTLTGDCLQNLRNDFGMVDDALCQRFADVDGRCSRIDLTLNLLESSVTPKLLNRALLGHKAHIRARKWRFIAGHDNGVNGDTVDTGSPKSDRRFRCYDKAAESKIVDMVAWTRLELQLRRLYARQSFDSCVNNGVSATVNGSIEDYLAWDNPEYLEALAGDSALPQDVVRKDTNRQRWLLGQVARALANEAHENPEFQARFNLMVAYWMEQLNNKS